MAKVTAARFITAAMKLATRPCSWECIRAVLAGVGGKGIERQTERAAAEQTVMAPGVAKARAAGEAFEAQRGRGAAAYLPMGEAPPRSSQPACTQAIPEHGLSPGTVRALLISLPVARLLLPCARGGVQGRAAGGRHIRAQGLGLLQSAPTAFAAHVPQD